MEPRFSIVTAVHNVERYLDQFIASVEAQTFHRDRFEVIAVDDGSTDGSLGVLESWAARVPGGVHVVTKPNGGQSTARNLGLEHATGEWVTFTDPDDLINPEYLSEVDAFIEAHPTAGLVACNMLVLKDATGELLDAHPLRHRFRGKAELRDLRNSPAFFFVSAPAGFFRRSRVEELGLRFDPRIRPNFEDGHFAGLYLLSLDRPLVGFVPEAKYEYRKRGDSTSTLDLGLTDPRRFTDVFRHGYIDLLKHAAAQPGGVPPWLQNLLLYELSWLVSDRVNGLVSATPAVMEVAGEFHGLVAEMVEYLDPDVVANTPIRRLPRLWREILMNSYRSEPWVEPFGLLTRLDRKQRLVKLVYRYTGDAPTERFLSGGVPVLPAHETVRDYEWLGRVVLYERIVWLPTAAPLRVQVGGRDLELLFRPPEPRSYIVKPRAMRRSLDHTGLLPEQVPPSASEGHLSPSVRLLNRARMSRSQFHRAWVLMDRVHDADDNGQRLFEYLRSHRPEINAWFVVEKGTHAWNELRKKYGKRVVAYGSLRWQVLLLNAEHLLSSHADQAITAPDRLVEMGVRPEWRFTFLQHGVIKDDLSTWLNPKAIDNFVTSTQAEYDSIAAPHTNYVFSDREVILTGLPRFDRLRDIGARFGPGERDLVLLAPTWRNWLTEPTTRDSQRRQVTDDFFESEFTLRWLEVLQSEKLRTLAEDSGFEVGFLPHPNLQAALGDYPLPDHVRPFTFDDHDVQELFARAAVLMTDYSSMAFNSAYIDRAVVYYQFDSDEVLGGSHIGLRGYFDYERDGFGPVTHTADEAVDAVVEVFQSGRVPGARYQARIDAAFPQRDGRCCERVTDAVLESARPRELFLAPEPGGTPVASNPLAQTYAGPAVPSDGPTPAE